MSELTSTRFDGTKTMQQHVLDMANLASSLGKLGMTVEDDFLVQFILNSLPDQYGPFQIHYNTINEKWNVNQLSNKLVQEEGRLRQQNVSVAQANFMHGNGKGKTNKGWKGGKTNHSNHKGSSNLSVQSTSKKIKKDECKFCHKVGHIQRDCIKRKEWFEKKGIPYNPDHYKTK
ncbi:hypothetical protein LINPERHAP1_LOCUS14292 [Linum perenne]